MIANFSDDTGELYVFFDEDELENLDKEPVRGTVADADDQSLGTGDVSIVYEPDLHGSRPLVGRDAENGEVGDFEIVVGQGAYESLLDGEAYEFSAGAYESVPHGSDVRIMPYSENGFDHLLEELDEIEGYTPT